MAFPSIAQKKVPSFRVIPLGTEGGVNEANLSAYLVAPGGSDQYICLDAGTLYAGIEKAIRQKALKGEPEKILKDQVKGYLISHGHLDHVAGLIMNSPEDSPKYIYGRPRVLEIIRNHYVSWDTWANFGNEGEKPVLNKYTYVPLEEARELPLQGTQMTLEAYELSHVNPYKSTAFLIRSGANYLLYLGDTGSDELEKANNLHKLWQRVAPLVNAGQLKAIFMEVSFSNEQADSQLFGHLTPRLFYQELKQLEGLTVPGALQKVSVLVTHIKPPKDREQRIWKELKENNELKIRLVLPEQGKLLRLE